MYILSLLFKRVALISYLGFERNLGGIYLANQGFEGVFLVVSLLIALQVDPVVDNEFAQPKGFPTLPRTFLDFKS